MCVAIFTFLLAGLVADTGTSVTVVTYTTIIYLISMCFIGFRRTNKLTKADHYFVRWGFILIYLLGMLFFPFVWHIRGVD